MKRVRQIGKRLAAFLARLRPDVDLVDVHVYGGGIVLSVGLWLVAPPYALVAFGALLVWLGLRGPTQ